MAADVRGCGERIHAVDGLQVVHHRPEELPVLAGAVVDANRTLYLLAVSAHDGRESYTQPLPQTRTVRGAPNAGGLRLRCAQRRLDV